MRDWKSCGRVTPPRGFESHPLRFRVQTRPHAPHAKGANSALSCLYLGMRGQSRTAEEFRRLADAQHGVVTRAQLLGAGVPAGAIDRRVQSGILVPEYRGVFRVGHRAPSMEASYLAAVLACGKGSLLSGRAAGHLLGLLKGATPGPEVTTATQRRVHGIRTRRCAEGDRSSRHDALPGDSRHDCSAHARRPRRGPAAGQPRSRVS